MLNPAFENWTATIYRVTENFDWLETSCEETVLHEKIGVQICCGDGKTNIGSCGVKQEQEREIVIRINPTYTFPDARRDTYIMEIFDCLWTKGKYQVDDINCIMLPSSWIYCYKLTGYKI